MNYKRNIILMIVVGLIFGLGMVGSASAQSLNIDSVDISDKTPGVTGASYTFTWNHSNVDISSVEYINVSFTSEYDIVTTDSSDGDLYSYRTNPTYIKYTESFSSSQTGLFVDISTDNPSTEGYYDLNVEYLDNNNNTLLSETYTATIGNPNTAPTADFSFSPSSPTEGEQITFNANGSSDPDGDSLTYSWDVNDDGSYEETGETINYNYSTARDYNVTLKVSDGSLNDTTVKTVTVSTPSYSLDVHVENSSNSSVENATVTVVESQTDIRNTSTDSSGNSSFTLEEGSYTVEAVHPTDSNLTDSTSVNLTSDKSITLTLTDDTGGGGGSGGSDNTRIAILLGIVLALTVVFTRYR